MGTGDRVPRPADAGALMDRVVAVRQQIAVLEAEETTLLAALGDTVDAQILGLPVEQRRAQLPLRDVAARLGARVRVADRTVQGWIGTAQATVTAYPATVAAWGRGEELVKCFV